MREPVIYLCGPIQGRTDTECKTWREYVAAAWRGRVLDPLRRDYRGRHLDNPKQLVQDDLLDIQNSDVVLVYYDRPSVGTSMEVFYASHVLDVPVVLINHGARFTDLSPWLVVHSTMVTVSIDAGIDLAHTLGVERVRACETIR